MVITAARAFVDGVIRGPVTVAVESGRIVEVRWPGGPGGRLRADRGIVLEDGLLTPGLVDLQLNGAFGVDLPEASPEGWATVRSGLARAGVTAFQPTFVSAPLEALAGSFRCFTSLEPADQSQPGARVIGLHLEGPFLSPLRAGAHDLGSLVLPTAGNVTEFLASWPPGAVTMVTLAPELPGAMEAIGRLRAAGAAVSIGHSNALAEEVAAAAAGGASMVTHVFNAQRGLTQREPGVAGQALVDDRLGVGLIADLVHVAPQVCRLVMRAAGGRVALVSDAVSAAAMPPGRYRLGGGDVEVGADLDVARRGDGTIAGATVLLDQAVRNLASIGVPLEEVLAAVTRVPAEIAGRADLGRIAPGALADLVLWDESLRPVKTFIGGTEVAR